MTPHPTPHPTPDLGPDVGRPLLLLDFDGPLNPAKRRPGFEPHHVADETERVYAVHVAPVHGRVLNRLAADFDLAWATTWWRVANERLSPLLGLPDDLPCVRLPSRHDHPFEGGANWKTPHVRRFADGRPLVWFDDEISDDVDGLALRSAHPAGSVYAGFPASPHALCVRVDPRRGLEREHIDAAKDWLTGLPR